MAFGLRIYGPQAYDRGVKYMAVHRAVLGVWLAFAGLARAADAHAPNDKQIQAAINGLAAGDPQRREAAAQTLINFGAEARRALSDAAQDDPDPELRARASALLLKLPWFLPDDSPAVRSLLEKYGGASVEQRLGIVRQLADLTQHGYGALARLAAEEPSDDVKWAIASVVRATHRDASLAPFRKLDTATSESAPVLAAAGHAWLPKDVAKGTKLLERALALDLERPANDFGEVEAAYERVEMLALLNGHYDRAADLLRARARRVGAEAAPTESDDEPSRAVVDLFAAHAKFGPLKGFEADVAAHAESLSDPRVQFALAKILERTGQRVLAGAVARAAFLGELVWIEGRLAQGDWLLRHGWLDEAEGQFRTVFDLAAVHSLDPGRRREGTPDLDAANANLRLAQVAIARDDDAAAAWHLREGLGLHKQGRGVFRGPATIDSIQQEIEWHELRAARAKGDRATVMKLVERFVASPPTESPDVANDVVPLLRDAGRADEAKAMFDQVYAALKNPPQKPNRVAVDPDHPMAKNNLAWLCARCGERKDEALRLATEASAAIPDNFAYLDTLAEANYQVGNFDEAVRIETRVVAARPNDRFLQGQLKRFRDAAAAAKSKSKQ